MELEKASNSNQRIESAVTVDFSSFYITLIALPEQYESFETINILNYFGFPINIEEDNILKQTLKKEMGFRPED